jgi:glycosyltransferase involved in cell wall biosynthesis
MAYYALADAFLCLSEHEGFCVPLVEAMSLGVPIIAFDAGAVAETLRGGGVLLKEKHPEIVAELLRDLVAEGPLRRAVLATQRRAIDEIRRIDFGALLLERLSPVLQGRA